MRTSYTSGLIYSGESEVTCSPSMINPPKKYCISVHGAGDDCWKWMTIPTRWPVMQAIARAGYTFISADLGGPQTWGNQTQQDRITGVYNYIQSLGPGNEEVLVVGQSMGGLGSLIWAANNKSKVKRVACLISVISLNSIYDMGGMYADLINSAYGGNYNKQTMSEYRDPLTMANIGKMSGVDIAIWYGASDQLCLPKYAAEFSRVTGAISYEVPGGHEEVTIPRVLNYGFLDFISD